VDGLVLGHQAGQALGAHDSVRVSNTMVLAICSSQ